MNVEINETDKFKIKKDCMTQGGLLKYKKALELLKFEDFNPS